jgi:hypothetical protein
LNLVFGVSVILFGMLQLRFILVVFRILLLLEFSNGLFLVFVQLFLLVCQIATHHLFFFYQFFHLAVHLVVIILALLVGLNSFSLLLKNLLANLL